MDCRKMLSGKEGLANLCKKSWLYFRRKGTKQFIKRVSDVVLGADSISYERWRRKYGTTKQQLEEQRGVHFSYEPKVSILVPLYRTPEKYLKELVASVKSQTYGKWELVLSDGSGEHSLLRLSLRSWPEGIPESPYSPMSGSCGSRRIPMKPSGQPREISWSSEITMISSPRTLSMSV